MNYNILKVVEGTTNYIPITVPFDRHRSLNTDIRQKMIFPDHKKEAVRHVRMVNMVIVKVVFSNTDRVVLIVFAEIYDCNRTSKEEVYVKNNFYSLRVEINKNNSLVVVALVKIATKEKIIMAEI